MQKLKPLITKKRVLAAGGALLLLIAALIVILNLPHELVPLEQEEIAAALARNTGVSDERQALIDNALSLTGTVHYFWGGKSTATGRDPRWGELTTVKSQGSATSGTQRPFGLDCSGFVSWAFIQLGYTPQEVEQLIGNGTYNQWYQSAEIKWKELKPGDLVFQNAYPTDKGNHIGICIGFTERGKPLFVHCASSFDNVVVTEAGDVFRYARRPSVFLNEIEVIN